MPELRKASLQDHDQIWNILKPIIEKGDSLAYPASYTKEEMLAYWCGKDKNTYVALDEGEIVGTFYIKNNQPGRGSHIANAGYAVSFNHSGKGMGKAMGKFSIGEAKRLGYSAIQFNLVVKSNETAVKLWKSIGFEIIGEIPQAFNHSQQGLTNAYIMYRKL